MKSSWEVRAGAAATCRYNCRIGSAVAAAVLFNMLLNSFWSIMASSLAWLCSSRSLMAMCFGQFAICWAALVVLFVLVRISFSEQRMVYFQCLCAHRVHPCFHCETCHMARAPNWLDLRSELLPSRTGSQFVLLILYICKFMVQYE